MTGHNPNDERQAFKVDPIRVLTAEEVSEKFQIKPRQVKELARQGKIPAIKVGKFWRFPEDALIDWMQSGEIPDNNEREIDSIVDQIISEVS